MVALRAALNDDDAAGESRLRLVKFDAADWLPLQQAACELDVSTSTIRRMIRDGRLLHRVVARSGRRAYVVYVPDSRHGAGVAHAEPRPPIDITSRIAERDQRRIEANPAAHDEIVERLEQQVEHLSNALARSLRVRQKALPGSVGQPGADPTDPYARYRWLARRRRWWPFS